MEDCHVSHQSSTWGHPSTFLGVYDGHGGRDIVNFLQDALHKNVAEEMNVDDDADINTRLERAFLITDVQSHMKGIKTSGATVALCLVERNVVGGASGHDGDKMSMRVRIHAANSGDGRAVLSCRPSTCTGAGAVVAEEDSGENGGSSFRLTKDHKADDAEEIDRIENAGGFLLRNRVLGIMAVARSLGDHGMKEFVIGRPFCRSIEFDLDCSPDDGEEFVIVACDGLWDTMEDEEAVDLVRTFVMDPLIDGDEKEMLRDIAAQMLCSEAMRRGTTDNVTVLVAWL